MANQPGKIFLESLPVIKLGDLPEDSQTCHICHELYTDPSPEGAENPVKLPCGHVLGSECLAKWFNGSKNSCPMCRAILFSQNTTNASVLAVTENLSVVTTPWATAEQRHTVLTVMNHDIERSFMRRIFLQQFETYAFPPG